MKIVSIIPGLRNIFRQFFDDVSKIGPSFAVRAAYSELFRKLNGRCGAVRMLRVKGYPHPIWYRSRSSDLKVVRQVIYHDGFGACRELGDVKRVLDCGGNIGLAAIVLLELWPTAKVAIVEPDINNIQMCLKNLKPYGDRVSYYHAGIWSHSCRLVVERRGGDCEEWSYSVRPVLEGEAGDVDGIDLCALMDREGFERVDYIKLDIEGSEEQILLPGNNAWIGRVGAFSVELHSANGKIVLDEALVPYDATVSNFEGHFMMCSAIRLRS